MKEMTFLRESQTEWHREIFASVHGTRVLRFFVSGSKPSPVIQEPQKKGRTKQ
jgi:hypothetical protein